jgi:choline kinase
MQAVLLAAGMGLRLRPYTEELPKTLLEVQGRAVVDYIMSSLDLPQIEQVIVVGGFQYSRLVAHMARFGDRVRMVENPNYRVGSIRTVDTALPLIDHDFVLLNGDHIHPREMIQRFITSAQGIACACDRDRDLGDDDMKVKLRDGVIERIDKKLSDYDCGYIGMTFFHGSRLDTYRDYVAKTLESRGESANVEAVVQELADGGEAPVTVDLSGLGWVELDTEDDLKNANRQMAENPNLRRLGEG